MPSQYVGRRCRCPRCKAKNTIPSPDDTMEDSIINMFNDIDKYDDEHTEPEDDDDEPDPFSLTQDGLDDMGNINERS